MPTITAEQTRRTTRLPTSRPSPASRRADARFVGETIPTEPGGDGLPRPAVDPAVWALHARYFRHHDPKALEDLAVEYDRYAISLANRLHRHGEPLEDLEQIAREALLVALRRFDPTRGIPFPGFATPTILGAIRRHYRDHGWSVRVPRWVHDTTVAVRKTAESLTASLGRTPTVQEIADALDISVERILHAEEAAEARTPGSLDTGGSADGSGAVHDLVGRTDRRLAEAENHVALGQAMAELGSRDRELIGLYYFEELSQSEIAARYGVSQMQVSRWLSSAVGRIRGRLAA
jgi:RNA polymerase sigma-B factor